MTLLTSKRDRVSLAPVVRQTFDELEPTVVKAKYFAVDYTMTTATNAVVIPAGAIIINMRLDVTTAFNDSGTDVLDVGIPGTAQQYRATGVDVSSAGQTNTGWQNMSTLLSADTVIIVTYTGQNANATAGAAFLVVEYIQTS